MYKKFDGLTFVATLSPYGSILSSSRIMSTSSIMSNVDCIELIFWHAVDVCKGNTDGEDDIVPLIKSSGRTPFALVVSDMRISIIDLLAWGEHEQDGNVMFVSILFEQREK